MKKIKLIAIILIVIYILIRVVVYFYDGKKIDDAIFKINNVKVNYSMESKRQTKIIPYILDVKKTTKKKAKDNIMNDYDKFNFDINIEVDEILIIKDDKEIYKGRVISDLSSYINEDGTYEIKMSKKIKESKFITKDIKYSFILKIDIPLTFDISKKDIKQGDYFLVSVSNLSKKDNISITSNFDAGSKPCYKEERTCFSYIAIPIATKTGDYKINIINNKKQVKEYSVNVITQTFGRQNLKIEQTQVNDKRTEEAQEEYSKVIEESRKNLVSERMFEDSFLMPVVGRITTEFGIYRYTNDDPNPRRHYGIDIAASKGTQVRALASGKIKIARLTIMAGNMIIIDHGMGLFSQYLHLDTLKVKDGDIIKQGDIIGTVGTTGFSTGPHLDFSVLFNDTYTSPWQFINR